MLKRILIGAVAVTIGTTALHGAGSNTRTTKETMTIADRDGMLQSSMERGVKQGFERLDEVPASQQKAGSSANV